MNNKVLKGTSMRSGLKSGLVDMFSVVFPALVATGVILLTYKYSEWMSLISYLFALAFLVLGMAVSYFGLSRRLSFVIHNSIMAFLCVMVSTDALKVAASTTLDAFYKDTPLQLIPQFLLESFTAGMSWWYIVMECVVVTAVMFAYRWFDEIHRRKNSLKG